MRNCESALFCGRRKQHKGVRREKNQRLGGKRKWDACLPFLRMCSGRGRSFPNSMWASGKREAMIEPVSLFVVTGLSQGQ